MTPDEALDLILSIRNRCEVAQLVASQGAVYLLCTLFEDIYEDAQDLMEFCRVSDG